MLVRNLIFIFFKLSLDHFLHQIDGHVHIVARLFRSDDASFHRDRHLNFLPVLFYAQGDVYFCLLGEVLFQLADLRFNRAAQALGNFDVFPADNEFHADHPFCFILGKALFLIWIISYPQICFNVFRILEKIIPSFCQSSSVITL